MTIAALFLSICQIIVKIRKTCELNSLVFFLLISARCLLSLVSTTRGRLTCFFFLCWWVNQSTQRKNLPNKHRRTCKLHPEKACPTQLRGERANHCTTVRLLCYFYDHCFDDLNYVIWKRHPYMAYSRFYLALSCGCQTVIASFYFKTVPLQWLE